MFAESKDFFEAPSSFFEARALNKTEKTAAARTPGFSFNLRTTAAVLCVAANFLIASSAPQNAAHTSDRTPMTYAASSTVHGPPPKVPLRLVRDARLLDRVSNAVELDQLEDPDYGL